MRRFLLPFILGVILLTFVSCQLTPEEEFNPRLTFEETQQGAFRTGSIPKEYLKEKEFIRFISTSGLYGYIYILGTDPLTVDWLIFNEDGEILKHRENFSLSSTMDFDEDGVGDLVPEATLLVFHYSEGSENYSLFSYEFPNGVFAFTPDGGRIYETDPEKFDPVPVGGASPTATLVYYDKDTFPDVKVGDVILDVGSYPYLGRVAIRKVLDIQDMDDVVRVESTLVKLEDIVPVLRLRFKGGMTNAIPLNEDAEQFMTVSKAEGDHLLSYEGSKTLYSGKHATVTASYGFSLDTDFDIGLDYDWNSFSGYANASLNVSHDLLIKLTASGSYTKKGEKDPFFRPSFTFSVYGIPVVVSFPVYAGYEFNANATAEATLGYDLSGGIEAGCSISGELSFSGIETDLDKHINASGDADLIGPEYEVNGEVKLRLYIGLDVEVSVAGGIVYAKFINHPYLEPRAEGVLVGNPYPDGKVDTEIGYGIDFSLKAGYDFKAKSGDWEKHLKDWKLGEFGPWTFGFPAPPSDLRGKFEKDKGVILSWKDNSSYEDGYEITRKKFVSGSWTEEEKFEVGKDATGYTDDAAQPNIRYRYTVVAYSDWPVGYRYRSKGVSYEVQGTPPPKPSDPRVSPSEDAASLTPTLYWRCDDPTGDTLSFDLYLGTTNPPPLFRKNVATGLGPEFSYKVDTLLQGETTYYWKLVVHDGEGFTVEGDVWTFTTIPQNKRYLYILAFNKNPNIITTAVFPISGLKVKVNGEVVTTPATKLVDLNSNYTLEAPYNPDLTTRQDPQWLFVSWYSPKESNDPVMEIEITDDTQAVFIAHQFSSVFVDSTEGGTADILEEGRNSFYELGTQVTVRATPSEGYEFDGWYVNDEFYSDSRTATVAVSGPTRILAKFVESRVNLTFTSTPVENVKVLVDGEEHITPFVIRVEKGDHEFEFVNSSDEEIGVASTLYYFSTWKIGNVYFDDNPDTFNISTDTHVEVNVNVLYKIDRKVVPEGGGVILLDPDLNNGYLEHNTELDVTAHPTDFYRFDHMEFNGEPYYDDFRTLIVTEPLDIVAYFEYTGP